MKIVAVNDDGFHDPGLWALAAALARLGDLRVYAPDRNYSGAGMSVTLRGEFHVSEGRPPAGVGLDVPAFTIDATPATTAALACLHAFDGGPDVLVSGINTGWNSGFQAYVVSGTVGAARVAVDRGTTGVAVSAPGRFDNPDGCVDYEAIARATARAIDAMAQTGELGKPLLVNINSPAGVGASTPVRLTSPARFTIYEDMRRVDGRTPEDGRETIRLAYGDVLAGPIRPGDEADALRSGAASMCVTDPFTSRVVSDGPWPSIAKAFTPAT